jgi:nitrous oxidase accessory protein NosD
MCDEQVISIQKIILQSVTMLQRVEETFPALRDRTVIDVYPLFNKNQPA